MGCSECLVCIASGKEVCLSVINIIAGLPCDIFFPYAIQVHFYPFSNLSFETVCLQMPMTSRGAFPKRLNPGCAVPHKET